MSKRILFIGGNFSPEQTGIGKYSGEMIEWLSQEGFDCTVVTTYPYYPQWKVQVPYNKSLFWYKKEIIAQKDNSKGFTIIRCPHYVPKMPTGLKRIISDLSFFVTSSFVIIGMLFKKKNDYILSVAPPFCLGLLGVLYKKLKGAKFMYHIQDLQIEVAQDLEIVKSKFLLKTLFVIERYIFNNADFISTISQGMIKKVKQKAKKEVLFLPNWVDIQKFYPINNKKQLKSDFNLNISDKIVLYSGAIGEKQGLEAILDSAKYFENIVDLKFVICGSGPYKENLLHLKKKMNLKNVIFLPLQPFEKLNSLLNVADVHLVLQKNSACDLMMPSKLSTILSVGGVSIVTAKPGSSLFNVIDSNNAGFLIEPECQDALNSAIKYAISNEHVEIESNARCYAEKNLSIHKILSTFAGSLKNNNSLSIPKISQKSLPSIAR
ncbi:MAG TPA: WcaI family glycosyltransferase [Chitinophagaceae bacterium]|nr:WcaI family glycosyltransferase [Chitinophagaceae bacterium]